MLWEGWCSSAGRCHNTGHSSPQQQSLHRQVILHQQAFQQLGEIDTTKRRRGGGGGRRRRGTQEEPIDTTKRRRGGGGGRRRRGTQEEPIETRRRRRGRGRLTDRHSIECAVSMSRQTETPAIQFCRGKEVVLVNYDDLYFSLQGTVL
ncbi:uncharacterized protein LOC127002254 isoform X2 [Eriocheir sinensis]|uniref:uncharacterized protein LOC127002254 isoform X1 n=1 Tax=Eriocheir sinensis TaxID=95602 RepID=UPI0021C7B8D4|nr:uncharacterized protein LOC127002254 isoform X1 [Eriocheir sinensis]XP_050724022.1 uncharacterized protein LOC127002254 isoform X2 [Eriocheir sinensis]